MAGYEADSVTGVDAFRRKLLEFPPDVIVLDLQLGDTDGIEQLRFLADQKFAGALVLASGFDTRVLATASSLGQGLGLNIVARLTKPIAVDQLDAVLERLRAAGQPLSAARLLQAVQDEELSLDFQPVVTRHPNTVRKLEALVRWEHPTLGRIPPDKFIGEVESDGELVEVFTDWVIGTALDAYVLLRRFRLSVPIAVNLSARNVGDMELPDRLEKRLRGLDIPPGHLCLEITEGVAFQDSGRSMDILSRLRLKGIALSLDDFGTGYSSLKVLRQMPFSEIKIDRVFVSDVVTSRDSRVIVKSIIDLAHNMDMASVAEGVETEAAAAALESMGVGALQGFLIAQPMPIENVPAWVAGWTGQLVLAPATGVPASLPVADPAKTVALKGEAALLTGRQLEVMQLVTDGLAVKEIARRLDIGIGTVKMHLSAAYLVLGARNRVEAVMRAGLTPGAGSRSSPAPRG